MCWVVYANKAKYNKGRANKKKIPLENCKTTLDQINEREFHEHPLNTLAKEISFQVMILKKNAVFLHFLKQETHQSYDLTTTESVLLDKYYLVSEYY